jgi:hypothetical protein
MIKSLRTPITNDKDFEKHPEGTFAATCYQVIDLGTHYSERFEKSTHLVRVQFESAKKMADGRPFSIGKQYTLSHHEKSGLRRDLESWYAKRFDSVKLNEAQGFDLGKLIGRPAMITVAHSEYDGKTYANIISLNSLPEGMPVPVPVNETLVFSLADFDPAAFEKLTDWTKKKINESQERNPDAKSKPTSGPASNVITEIAIDDIPF